MESDTLLMVAWIALAGILEPFAGALNCYECGGNTGKDCLEFTPSVKFEVQCNTTAFSCMSADRDGALEQKMCWTRDSNTCDSPIPGQLRVCTCTRDLCNCFAETGSAALVKDCPSSLAAPANAQLRSTGTRLSVERGAHQPCLLVVL
eukprot:maker-scaffold631_size122145-snap-gene-0.39 protein:Tk01056 transcript:maker-scaffold631_size122145-snap-gene-0.39-mRNA-1 annotation:"PREDICTED: uncharacterized protein LOC103312666"